MEPRPIIQPVPEADLQERGYLAKYEVKRVYLELPPEAMEGYRKNLSIYHEYCASSFPNVLDPRRRFELCLKYAARDPRARDALRARSRARMIALSAERKIEMVRELLSNY